MLVILLTQAQLTKRLRLLRLSRPIFHACEQYLCLFQNLPLIITFVWYRFRLKVVRFGFRSVILSFMVYYILERIYLRKFFSRLLNYVLSLIQVPKIRVYL